MSYYALGAATRRVCTTQGGEEVLGQDASCIDSAALVKTQNSLFVSFVRLISVCEKDASMGKRGLMTDSSWELPKRAIGTLHGAGCCVVFQVIPEKALRVQLGHLPIREKYGLPLRQQDFADRSPA
jgi:hypothetical protein